MKNQGKSEAGWTGCEGFSPGLGDRGRGIRKKESPLRKVAAGTEDAVRAGHPGPGRGMIALLFKGGGYCRSHYCFWNFKVFRFLVFSFSEFLVFCFFQDSVGSGPLPVSPLCFLCYFVGYAPLSLLPFCWFCSFAGVTPLLVPLPYAFCLSASPALMYFLFLIFLF